YLPSLGYCLIAAYLFFIAFKTEKRKVAATIILVFLCSFYSIRTWARNIDFKDDIHLFTKTVTTDQNCVEAHTVLGNAYLREQEYKKATKHYELALLPYEGYTNFKTPAAVNNNAGYAYELMGEYEEAVLHYKRAIELVPDRKLYQDNLKIVLKKLEEI
ncbi:tetratricopeptide repeat protein, partial [Candidatus Margulisiibacteriota bacterium]